MQFVIDSSTDTSSGRVLTPGRKLTVSFYRALMPIFMLPVSWGKKREYGGQRRYFFYSNRNGHSG